eukprot:COSAG02_NODE_44779_length_363_cov_0.621212_1_plen_113_part_10
MIVRDWRGACACDQIAGAPVLRDASPIPSIAIRQTSYRIDTSLRAHMQTVLDHAVALIFNLARTFAVGHRNILVQTVLVLDRLARIAGGIRALHVLMLTVEVFHVRGQRLRNG